MTKAAISHAINKALQFHQTGRLAEAEKIYRQIIAQFPNHVDALQLLGVLMHQIRRHDEALDLVQRAISFKPDFAEANYNLGLILNDLGRIDEAIVAYSAAIRAKPGYANAHNNLGMALTSQRRHDEACAAFLNATRVRPDFAEAHYNLGNTLANSGRFAEATSAYLNAIRVKPAYAEAYGNMGISLREQGKYDDSIVAFNKAIELKPDMAEAYANLGSTLKDRGNIDEGLRAVDRAIALAPDNPAIHSIRLFTIHFHPDFDSVRILADHREWDRRHAQRFKSAVSPHPNDRSLDRRLKIGYVSSDFRSHPLGRCLVPLMKHHDHSTFEIVCYSDVTRPDEMTARLRTYADTWHDIVGFSDEQAAELIRGDRIDILVDLNMHAANNRLLVFARKPAPVQVTYLAYCSTTGLEAIDFRLTDPYLDPPGSTDANYSEKSIRLPNTYWCYEPIATAPETGPLPAQSRGHITFGCLNKVAKVSAAALDTWCELLRAVPQSRLILHAHEGSHRNRVAEIFSRGGVDPARLEFVDLVSTMQYLQTYQRIDIGLDPFPYAGGATTCDALFMGVPVVSLKGKIAVGRGGFSILSNVGLPQLVADTPERYIRIATTLAEDLGRLAKIRCELRVMMQRSALMNGSRFALNVEIAYRNIWRAHQWPVMRAR